MAIDEKKLKKDLLSWYSGKRAYCINHGFYDLLNDFEDCFDAFTEIIDEQPKLSLETKQAINEKTSDNVNHPKHYQGKNECIDVMIAMFGIEAVKSFCKCNAYKYRFRAQMKNGQEDIKKAEWYESKLIELSGVK